jgi:hypothetical protein
LDSILLTNRSQLFLVAHRTGHPVEAYEVCLYRVDQYTNVFVCFLGHAESFWWGSSLQHGNHKGEVRIAAFWSTVGVYSVPYGFVDLSYRKTGSYPSYMIDGVNVKWPIPQVVLDASNKDRRGRVSVNGIETNSPGR